jgi:DNA-directed RNA polymerase specialized sigma subunit
MHNCTADSLDQVWTPRHALREYLADLPILDNRVLQLRFSEKEDPAKIAAQMHISEVHVERILNRARHFTNALRAG